MATVVDTFRIHNAQTNTHLNKAIMLLPNSLQSPLLHIPGKISWPLKPSKRPHVLIMAARGRHSLTPEQQGVLASFSRVQYQTVRSPMTPDAFVQAARHADFLAITRRAIERLSRDTLAALPQLKGLSVYSTGTEWIDTRFLQQRGIALASLPDYCTNAVAETALGLLLMSAHKLHLRYLKSTHAVPAHVSLRGRELRSGVVGIIGHGRIGSLLAQKVQPLCKQVLVCDKSAQQCAFLPPGLRAVAQHELLSQADWIVCCASQDYAENPLLEPEDYGRLKPQTVLINVGRSSLFDHKRLIQMVQAGQLGGYFFDDLLRPGDNPNLSEYGKIVPMGHTAWYTDEAMEAGRADWVNNLCGLITQHTSTPKFQVLPC